MSIENEIKNNDTLHEALDILHEIKQMESNDSADYIKLASRLARIGRRKKIRRITIGVASAILPIVAAGLIFLSRSEQDIDSLVVSHVPFLELADGKTVQLNPSLGDELIAEDSHVSIRIDDGKLRYDKKGDAPERIYSTLRVPRGASVYYVRLEDGTRVWLNAGSKLKFPAVFDDRQRKVFLDGEGYFEVAHDAQRPFWVETESMAVEVLGTEFNLAAYSDESRTVATLIRGSVQVLVQDGTSGVVLVPGQRAVLEKNTGKVNVDDSCDDDSAGWKDGLINMEKLSLEQITRSLSRIYDVEFIFTDERSAAITYRGSIPRYSKLSDALAIISSGSPVQFSAVNNVIRVSSK